MSALNKETVINYTYQFTFSNGTQHLFNINLSYPELKQIKPAEQRLKAPDWAKLNFHKCPNCALDEKTNQYCPAAESLIEILEVFKNVTSYEEVDVLVRIPGKEIHTKRSIQSALSSLLGLSLGGSNCPVFKKFAPMARFHLPFATSEETIYRSVSTYLLAQHFISAEGGKPDWELTGFKKFYQEVANVNTALSKRLANISTADANINALINLDCFAVRLSDLFDESIKELRTLFGNFLSKKP